MAEHVALKDSYTEKRLYGLRVVLAGLIVVLLLAVLVVRFFTLQITEHSIYQTQSDRNRVQLQPIPPKRGLVYDRHGELLADNRPSYSLTLVKEQVDDLDETILLLQTLIDIDEDHVSKFQKLLTRRRPHASVPLKLNLTELEIATVSVNRYRLPGVGVEAQLNRYYPQGKVFAHALGYVGRISEEEQWDLDAVNYSGTLLIGKIGLEKYYESQLHGKVGYQNVETNARGRVLRVLERVDPEPGADLHLHIDAHTQRIAHQALLRERKAGIAVENPTGQSNNSKRGAVVAIDPRTGGVIAMVSTPSFDANLFVGGISSRDYNKLRNSIDLPLFNRAMQGQYPPASTVKPVYGLAGLHYGVVTEQTAVPDPGWYQLPNDERRYRDWTWQLKRSGHGKTVALEQAIVESCDIYYYDLAYKMGIDQIHEFLSPFGYGKKTGIDNTHERSGLLPSREWKQRFKRMPWFPGETLSVGIGQGYMLATPLQLAVTTATIANRGVHFTPRLVQKIGDKTIMPPTLAPIELDKAHWDAVIVAMEKVVHGYRGTANRMNRGAKYKMAGKTGSAQVVGIGQDEKYNVDEVAIRHRDHGLFVGFAPVDNPRIVVAVIVENGVHGSWVSTIAREVFDAYLLDAEGNVKPDPASDVSPIVDSSVPLGPNNNRPLAVEGADLAAVAQPIGMQTGETLSLVPQ